jgi:hypothetical protein
MWTARLAEAGSVDLQLDVVPETGRPVIRVHGRLAGASVTELAQVCRSAPGSLLLDLTHVTSTDDEGIETLRRLVAGGVECTGVSRSLARRLGWAEG